MLDDIRHLRFMNVVTCGLGVIALALSLCGAAGGGRHANWHHGTTVRTGQQAAADGGTGGDGPDVNANATTNDATHLATGTGGAGGSGGNWWRGQRRWGHWWCGRRRWWWGRCGRDGGFELRGWAVLRPPRFPPGGAGGAGGSAGPPGAGRRDRRG